MASNKHGRFCDVNIVELFSDNFFIIQSFFPFTFMIFAAFDRYCNPGKASPHAKLHAEFVKVEIIPRVKCYLEKCVYVYVMIAVIKG